MKEPKNPFSIEEQFQFYLASVRLDPTKMPPGQELEMRRCFFGSWAQSLLMIRDIPDGITVEPFKEMFEELKNFWGNQTPYHLN